MDIAASCWSSSVADHPSTMRSIDAANAGANNAAGNVTDEEANRQHVAVEREPDRESNDRSNARSDVRHDSGVDFDNLRLVRVNA